MTLTLALAAALFYGWAVADLLRGRSRLTAAAAAVTAHGGVLVSALLHDGALVIGWTRAAALFSWQAGVLLVLFSRRQPLAALGLGLYPLAAITVLSAALWPEAAQPVTRDWRVALHVLLSLFSGGLLTLAALQAALLAWQEARLHRHQTRPALPGLPPVLVMERLQFRLIGVGFALLSASLLSGLWFLEDWLSQHLAHKTVLSITAWLIFGGLLLGRWRVGLRGRQATRWTLFGYGFLILAYFGSKFVLELLLGAQWRAA
jgi:ABC-type uncharacterized transport system permease subunit